MPSTTEAPSGNRSSSGAGPRFGLGPGPKRTCAWPMPTRRRSEGPTRAMRAPSRRAKARGRRAASRRFRANALARDLTARRTTRVYSQKRARACILVERPMPEPWNPTHAVRFEIRRGRVSVGGDAARLLIPPEALLQLFAGAGKESVRDFGRRLGTELGRRIASRLDGSSPVSTMVEHLGGELALSGLGSLGVEIWGRALVFTVDESP